MNTENLYKEWLSKATDSDISNELKDIADKPDEINDRFYKNLEFGTGGLRGIIGAGTNRMNIYTVGHATQGLSEYVKSVNAHGRVAIAYDSRNKSDVFAKRAASVLAANGIEVFIYKELTPTPMLSFAVRYLKCDSGIVITASHNPAKYNGYKAYGSDGCQLGLDESAYVLSIINSIDMFDGVKSIDFDQALASGKIKYIEDDVINAYLSKVKEQSVSDDSYDFDNLSVIYTPLHGSGNKPVRAILDKIGVKNVTVVKEQELPDGNFPTVPYPNPEFKQAFDCALELSKTVPADLLLATDPDSDRVGIAVNSNGEFKLLSGNDVGVLLLNYLLMRKTELNTLPKNPVAVKTIVTTELCKPVCQKYGCRLIDVLTGFKFIGEQIYLLEQKGEDNRYIFGFEESYGYLAGSYVRDKDAVVGSMLICEMVCYYKSKGLTLLDVLDKLYEEFGCYFNMQQSIICEGQSGMEDMSNAMERLRSNPPATIGDVKVLSVKDYKTSLETELASGNQQPIDLPSSNVLAFTLEDKSLVTVRPSGTEPKIKIYISAVSDKEPQAEMHAKRLMDSTVELLGL